MNQLMKLPELDSSIFEVTLKQLKDNVVHEVISRAGEGHIEEINLLDTLKMHCTALVISVIYLVICS